jgi:hypothetical protein
VCGETVTTLTNCITCNKNKGRRTRDEKPYKEWGEMKKICVIAGAIILLLAAGFTFYNSRIVGDSDDSVEFLHVQRI